VVIYQATFEHLRFMIRNIVPVPRMIECGIGPESPSGRGRMEDGRAFPAANRKARPLAKDEWQAR
jgi:hypothetical protein